MTEYEKTRKALVDQLANIIADYNARELSDTEWEGLNGEELECLLECLQFAQYKDRAIQALEALEKIAEIIKIEQQPTSCEHTKLKSFDMIENTITDYQLNQ